MIQKSIAPLSVSPEHFCQVKYRSTKQHRGQPLKPKRLKRKDRSLLWIGPNPTEDLCLRRGLNFSPARTLLFSMALESVFQVAVELHSSPPPLGNTEYPPTVRRQSGWFGSDIMNLFFTAVMLRIQLVADDGHAAALSNTSSAVCAQTPAIQGMRASMDICTVRTKYYNAQYKLCPRNLRWRQRSDQCGGQATHYIFPQHIRRGFGSGTAFKICAPSPAGWYTSLCA